jgi:hypothetical protein
MNNKWLVNYLYKLFIIKDAPFYEIFRTLSDFSFPFFNLFLGEERFKNMRKKIYDDVSNKDFF